MFRKIGICWNLQVYQNTEIHIHLKWPVAHYIGPRRQKRLQLYVLKSGEYHHFDDLDWPFMDKICRQTFRMWVLPARRYASAVLAVIVCPSVCPSVTSRCSTKTAKPRITQKSPSDSRLLMAKISLKFQRGHPNGDAKYRWNRFRASIFDQYLAISDRSLNRVFIDGLNVTSNFNRVTDLYLRLLCKMVWTLTVGVA